MVLPCLNENGTLAGCIAEIRAALSGWDPAHWEIIVSDNGSTDGSLETASRLNAKIVNVVEKGYGHAVRAGILAAASPHVIFVDADGTYPLGLLPELHWRMVQTDAALGIAYRIGADIEAGAMPWLHRRIGTPFFTMLINRLHRVRLSDCGSGLRCVNREWFLQNPHRAGGMEFASENIIRAGKSGGEVVQIPGGLRRSPVTRRPHLSTWSDGMRHLMFILSESPGLFEKTGLAGCAGASAIQALAVCHGPLRAGVFDILGLHSQLLALMAAVLSVQIYFMGVLLQGRAGEASASFTRRMLSLREDHLFFAIIGSCISGIIVGLAITALWTEHHFAGLSAERSLLGAVHVILLTGSFSLGFFGIHMTSKWRTVP